MRLRAASLALVLTALAARLSAAGPAAALPDRPGESDAPQVLFATAFPLGEVAAAGWTEAQRRTVAGIVDRVRADGRIRLAVRVLTDPIGPREENARWARAVAEAVAARLVASGVPPDRVAAEDGAEVGDLGGSAPWTGFERLQSVVISAVRAPPAPAGRGPARESR